MKLIALALLLASSAPADAQEDLIVLKPDASAPPARKMLEAYLLTKAKERFDARRQTIAAIKTPENVKQRQQEIRAKFLGAIGDMPERAPLNARVIGTDKRDGYCVERLIYESQPGHHVTAAFYLPEGVPPFPGVLLPCGHTQNGKAGEAYQRACILLAKNGFAVLCYDPIGQGERVQLFDTSGKPSLPGSTTEHTMAGLGALLVGRSAALYFIWDGMRSLDYLASRPEVDARRLGCTGNSGGGTMTSYLMALDDRIAVAAPSCYITSLERLFATVGPQDAEQNIPGQVAFGMDHADYVTMRAPRPTLLCVGTQDFFDVQGSWDTFREVKGIYGRLGFGERVELFESDETHGFTKPRREATLRWMMRWLEKKDEAQAETDFSIASDADLQCTKTGQVLSDFHGKSIFDLDQEREEALKQKRAQIQTRRSHETLLNDVRRLIALQSAAAAKTTARMIGQVNRDVVMIRKYIFETEPGIILPGLLCQAPKSADNGPLMVVVGGERDALLAKEGEVAGWLSDGARVLLLDLRGWGELAPASRSGTRPSPFGADAKEALLALHLNRPLLGQRVFDLLRVIDALAGADGEKIEIVGVGAGGPVALHAAALESKIARVTIDRAILSWSEVVNTPITQNQLANVVPGSLLSYDLSDLAASLAPRALTITHPVDPAGRPASQTQLDQAYEACKAAFRARGAGENLVLKADP